MRTTRALLPLLAVALASCGREPEALPDVLLVTLDTTRADRLGCYGHALARTPTLDALAARGVRFERAYAHAPLTLPSHATLLAGVLPPGHGLRVNFQGALSREVETLAEALRARGYRTGAFVAAWVLNADFGLDRGFDVYDDLRARTTSADVQAERPAGEVVDAALAWIARDHERPTFAWVHFYDAHEPYEPPPGSIPPGGDAYDGEIAYCDAQLGRLLEALSARGSLERTLVVVAADHGESLGEHGEATHGLFVYEAVARVPLIVAGPGVASGALVDAPVGLVDLHPTIVELCGGAPGAGLEGRSVARALRGEALEDAPVYVESEYGLRSFGWAPLKSLVTREWRFVEAPRPELYELERDPRELEDRSGARPEVVERMRAALGARLQTGARRAADAVELGAEDARQLESLGYVAGRAGEIEVEELSALRDPKDAVHVLRGTMQAKRLSDAGQHAEVVALLEPLLAESPESDEVWSLLAKSLHALGRYPEAAAAWERSLRAVPDQPDRRIAMGDAWLAAGADEAALACFERALGIDPDLGQGHSRAGLVHARAGRLELALEHFQRFVQLEPRSVNARFNLANALLAAQRYREGVDELQAALALEPDNARVLQMLPAAWRAAGAPEEELRALRRANALLPDDGALALRLAWRLATDAGSSADDARAALALAERFVTIDASQPEPLDVLAAASAACGDFERARTVAARALELAPAGELRIALEARLESYRADRPFRELR